MAESSDVTKSGEEAVVSVPDADPKAFKSLIDYIVSDKVDFEDGDASRAFETLKLARKHGMVRLEKLCMVALEGEERLRAAVGIVVEVRTARAAVEGVAAE